MVEAVRGLDLEVRAGLHTGECEIFEADVGGIAVHIGARVNAQAGPGEVLVSSTVKELVVGSDLRFVDRGPHELRGVPASGACSRSSRPRPAPWPTLPERAESSAGSRGLGSGIRKVPIKSATTGKTWSARSATRAC